MTEATFIYEGIPNKIQCNNNDKMKDIINKFLIKNGRNENDKNLLYIYGANIINYELTFVQQANELDRNRKKMNILVKSNDDNDKEIKEMISKNIICPECGENILIDIKDFKIYIYMDAKMIIK